jgi:hypothetical protein
MQRKLSGTPKIVFVGFDDKPIDLAHSLTKRINEKSTSETALSNYFKVLYNVGEAKQ